MKHNSFEKNYSLKSLIRFAIPSIIMMLVLSIYNVADGTFVSRYVGTTALSAVNMAYPIVSVEMAVAIMLSAGGSAIIAYKMGQDKNDEARQNFTAIVIMEIILGIIVALLGNIFIEPIVNGLGATEIQFEYCKTYLRVLLCFAPFFFRVSFSYTFCNSGKTETRTNYNSYFWSSGFPFELYICS